MHGFICRLSYLHSQKIVHRDVKTENMLLDKTRTVKIADFGVARVEASNPNDMTGETGTLGYMAPEVYMVFFEEDRYSHSFFLFVISPSNLMVLPKITAVLQFLFFIWTSIACPKICRFSMATLITGNAMCTVLAFAYGRYIVATCHIPTSASPKSLQQLLDRYKTLNLTFLMHLTTQPFACPFIPQMTFFSELEARDT